MNQKTHHLRILRLSGAHQNLQKRKLIRYAHSDPEGSGPTVLLHLYRDNSQFIWWFFRGPRILSGER